ncbi:O-antigen ligase family protein, partial [Blautia hominis]|nr:O-antigen ligase family protein [Blautia hominis]
AGVLRGPGFLRVSDFWGSNRGYIWKRTWELFLEAPPVRKLFGYGPDTLKLLMMQTSSGEMVEKTGQIYDSAHNDLLHLHLTTGIFGTAAWAGCFA